MSKIKKIVSFFLVTTMLLTSASGIFVTALDSDTTGIVLGAEYYIMNAGNKKISEEDTNPGVDQFLSLESESNAHGTPIVMSSRTNSNIKKWIIQESSTSGSYNIISSYSSTGYCMAMYYDEVCLFSSLIAPFSKLNITRSNEAGHEGLYLISNGEKYLAINNSGAVCVSDVITDNCYWSFMRSQKRDADFCYFNYPDSTASSGYFDTSKHISLYTTVMNDMGYLPYGLENFSPVGAYNSMRLNDDIFIYAGHGTPGGLAFYDNSGNKSGYIWADTSILSSYNNAYINSYPGSLNSLRCVLYIGCETGVDSSDGINLVDETYEQGAHFVLGLLYKTTGDDNLPWIEGFLEAINDGYNLAGAISIANDAAGETKIKYNDPTTGNPIITYIDTYPIYTRGDTRQYLG